MRQLIKYIIGIAYLPILALSIYLTFSPSLPYHSLWYISSDIILSLFLVLSICNTDDIQFTILRPSLHKKVFHESGKYYIFYNGISEKYILYRDYIVFRDEVYKLSGSEVEDTRGGETPEQRLTKKIKEKLDTIHHDRLKENKRKELVNNWDGYTSDQFRRDDKIAKII